MQPKGRRRKSISVSMEIRTGNRVYVIAHAGLKFDHTFQCEGSISIVSLCAFCKFQTGVRFEISFKYPIEAITTTLLSTCTCSRKALPWYSCSHPKSCASARRSPSSCHHPESCCSTLVSKFRSMLKAGVQLTRSSREESLPE
jgi:hypothetical protein